MWVLEFTSNGPLQNHPQSQREPFEYVVSIYPRSQIVARNWPLDNERLGFVVDDNSAVAVVAIANAVVDVAVAAPVAAAWVWRVKGDGG